MRQLPTEGQCLSKSLMRKCIIPHTCHTGSVCDLWFHQMPLGKRFKHVDATWRQAGASEMFWSTDPQLFFAFLHVRRWSTPGRIPRSSTFALLKGSWRSGENATCQPACLFVYFGPGQCLIFPAFPWCRFSSPVGSEGLEDWFDLKMTLHRSPLTWCRRAWRITWRRRGHLKGERIGFRPWRTWTREGFINIPLTKLRWFCESK